MENEKKNKDSAMKSASEEDALLDGLPGEVKAFVIRMRAALEEAHRDTIRCANKEHYDTIVQYLKGLNRTPNMKDLLLLHAKTGLTVSIYISDEYGRKIRITQYGICEIEGSDSLDHMDGGLPPSGLYAWHPEIIRKHYDATVFLNVTLILNSGKGDFVLVRGVSRFKLEEIRSESDEPVEGLIAGVDDTHLEYITRYDLIADGPYEGSENSKHESDRWR